IPIWYFTDQLASCKDMLVGLISFIADFLHTDKGIRDTLAPKSHKARKGQNDQWCKELKNPLDFLAL
ncbi:unnamed protein product, partial [Dovyalis caffra]